MTTTLRPVRQSDAEFLLELYGSTRAAEMALMPWTDAQKQAFLRMQFDAQASSYAKQFPAASHEIICVEAQPAGRLYLDRGLERFHILDIAIAQSRRNAGVGTFILRQILREAFQAGKPTSIYVEDFNPSIRLFERLGFIRASSVGFQILLRREPSEAL